MKKLAIALALTACWIVATHGRANAASEICPAAVADWHAFAPNAHGVVYGLVLDAASERSARGTIVVATNAGYFTFAFPETTFAVDHGTYTSGDQRFAHDRYLTQPLYVRFPVGVTDVTAWWPTQVQTTGEDVFGWDAQGMVRCALGSVAGRKPQASGFAWITNPKRTNSTPYDLTQLPAANVAIAPTSIAPPSEMGCAVPFADASALTVVQPKYPVSAQSLRLRSVSALIAVVVDETGTVDHASVFHSSGNADIDDAALEAASASTYKPRTVFCEPVPGSYLFLAEFKDR